MLPILARFVTKGCFNNPIFVVGTGRSGTSIMLQALGVHSMILSADRESPFIPYVGYLLSPFEFRQNRDYHRDSLNMGVDEAYEQFRKLCFDAVFGRYYGSRRRVMHAGWRKTARSRAWCAKTYPNQAEAEGLALLYPTAKFIYMHRSGCDVVNSRSRFRGMSKGTFEENCRIWADHVKKYQYLREMKQATRVRQEDVAANPDDVFRRVQLFVGLPFEDGPARFAKTTLIHPLNKRTHQTNVGEVFEKRRPVYETWTGEERATFKALCGDGMAKLGYDVPF